MQSNTWMRHVSPINTAQEIKEYVSLWEEISEVQRGDHEEDQIKWRWTTDGEYSAASAYKIQFANVFCKTKIRPIWKARAEPKCHFFAWTLLHKKILTADNLPKKGWPNNPICSMCHNSPETPIHLCKEYPFARQVWNLLIRWSGMAHVQTLEYGTSIYAWWRKVRTSFSGQTKRDIDGLIIFFGGISGSNEIGEFSKG